MDVSDAYLSIVQQARAPDLYAADKAPDSFDGRFDMMSVHVHLVLRRLRQEGVARDEIGQALFDLFFADMDQSMREAGVGDLGVGKKIRKMAQAYYGRAAAYDEAMGKQAPAKASAMRKKALGEVLARNLYPEAPEASKGVKALAAHLLNLEAMLAEKSVDDILAGTGFDA
ncbi:hypothetical protein N9Y74_03330 [Alphaproteobacteria bacterium]|nr:hypothetical protein [Alphaproteobacteria bacterium]